jgi:hypothetical protein
MNATQVSTPSASQAEWASFHTCVNLLRDDDTQPPLGKQVPRDPISLPDPWVAACLYFHGFVEHYRVSGRGRRYYRKAVTTRVTDPSRFALTAAGKEIMMRTLENEVQALAAVRLSETLSSGRLAPRYHADERRLCWGCHVVKCFRQPAANQELIPLTAEELAWPDWFDDPLSHAGGMNPKKRLHDTIKCLNHNQKARLIHFNGDGTGTRIGWELL